MPSPITTHVLDTTRGRPAAGVSVGLAYREPSGAWRSLAQGQTDAEGRVSALLPDGERLEVGLYRLTFEVAAYFQALGVDAFYPHITICFRITASAQHYHVPLLLSPYGYTTYRGS